MIVHVTTKSKSFRIIAVFVLLTYNKEEISFGWACVSSTVLCAEGIDCGST